MTRLTCPFCGPRELCEFEFHKTVPAPGSVDEYARTYLRVADAHLSIEHWQHVGGCRAWLQVQRNPSTGAVLAIDMLAGEPR
ncbi:MAG TPA: sarcosine oxidase subunit delta [Steroidobacteraceae bacterium]|nr:sarcosine oxidase subunit delta [Steroidobacteraceae bacterium]